MYLADTHALIWYIVERNLPKKVDDIFRNSENDRAVVYTPTIVLAECLYLIENGKIELDFKALLRRIKIADNFVIAAFDADVLDIMQDVKIPELHDRIIIATAKLLNAKVLTKDEAIANSKEVETIW